MKISLLFASATVCFLLMRCTQHHSEKPSAIKEIATETFTLDSCSVCSLDSFVVQPSKIMNPSIDVRIPVAVTFFNRLALIDKYQKKNYDTLMKILKMKHWGDRNVIYHLTEQYFIYQKEMMPILKDYSIPVIDTIRQTRTIVFLDNNKSYPVDVTKYRDLDGVLLFKPGIAPIFWTFDTEAKYCHNNYSVLVHQYYQCR